MNSKSLSTKNMAFRFGGAAAGAIAGIVFFASAMGISGIFPGIIYGALLGFLIQTMAQNWVPFDLERISNYKAPVAEWKRPDYKFDNTVATESAESITYSPRWILGAALFLGAIIAFIAW